MYFSKFLKANPQILRTSPLRAQGLPKTLWKQKNQCRKRPWQHTAANSAQGHFPQPKSQTLGQQGQE